jgi:thioredoxin reductase/Pyruvate/2-oxoacid:ferredoxin oxidoreductase delta subunit
MAVGQLVRRAVRQRRDAAALREKVEKGQHLARSLHPVVDVDLCIGSLSCLKACPEGDILGIVDGAARLIHADHCIGHGRCAAECPVGAIRLVFGSSERGVDLPEVDEYFESSRPGVHVVGELGGMGLIKNAVTQGLQAADRLAEVLPRRCDPVVVVGAGPGGIATALGLKSKGVPYRLLEQDTLGGTVAHYPRNKVVMTEAVVLPGFGRFGKKAITKEELLAGWQKIIGRTGLQVEEKVKVTAVDGRDGAFTVTTSSGAIKASKVVLAIGRRGSPRKLGVPGEDSGKVSYGLKEPEEFNRRRVLVVGGGDSAIEAAVQLATESSATVTISYRGAAFAKCREANRKRIGELAAAGKLTVMLGSQVLSVGVDKVQLDVGGLQQVIPNDHVVVCAGGELPTDFLKMAGVSMRRFHGEAPGRKRDGVRGERKRTAEEKREDRLIWTLRGLYTVVGVSVLAFLAWKGLEYYPLARVDRLKSPLHPALKSAGPWGHGVGIAATAFMLSNFLYALRKRSRYLTSFGNIRGWLDFHVFVGFMSPLVISFHAAFQSNNQLATATSLALGVVVLTGIVGRYIYGIMPAVGGRAVELEDLAANFERLRAWATPLLDEAGTSAHRLLESATRPVRSESLLGALLRIGPEALLLRLRIRLLQRHIGDHHRWLELHDGLLRLARLRWQIRFYASLRRLLRGWRVFHASLAVFLVLTIAAHIGVSLYLGYGLQFR